MKCVLLFAAVFLSVIFGELVSAYSKRHGYKYHRIQAGVDETADQPALLPYTQVKPRLNPENKYCGHSRYWKPANNFRRFSHPPIRHRQGYRSDVDESNSRDEDHDDDDIRVEFHENLDASGDNFGFKMGKMFEFPYSVILLKSFKWPNLYQDICIGSIVSDEWILTSADCCRDGNKFNLAVYQKFEGDSFEKMRFTELRSIVRTEIQSNLCLLRVNQSVPFDDFISPICLPESCEESCDHGDQVIANGFALLSSCNVQVASDCVGFAGGMQHVVANEICEIENNMPLNRLEKEGLRCAGNQSGIIRHKPRRRFSTMNQLRKTDANSLEEALNAAVGGKFEVETNCMYQKGAASVCYRNGYFSLNGVYVLQNDEAECGDPTKTSQTFVPICTALPWIRRTISNEKPSFFGVRQTNKNSHRIINCKWNKYDPVCRFLRAISKARKLRY